MNRILVIGSNSFSGSRFVDTCLAQDFEVWGISRSTEIKWPLSIYSKNPKFLNFHFLQSDMNSDADEIVKLIKRNKIDCIVNFAAQSMVGQSWDKPEDWYNTNLVGFSKLINKIKLIDTVNVFIQFTTPEVYGNTNDWIVENFDFHPTTPYAISRAASDFHLKLMFENYGFPVIFTRAANVFGKGQPLYRIIPKMIYCLKTKTRFVLDGGGISERSFIEMEDVSYALLKILSKGKLGSSYHISTNRLVTIKSLLTICAEVLNIDSKNIFEIGPERPGKDLAYRLNSDKIRSELGWHDQVSLEDGIIDTYKWISDNLEDIERTPKHYIHKE